MKIKIAELIRKIKATSKKSEEILSELRDNIVCVTFSEKESENITPELVEEKFNKIVSERTTTTEKALKEYEEISGYLRSLRLALDDANAHVAADYNGKTYCLKALILLYSEKQRLLGAVKQISARKDISPWDKRTTMNIPQISEKQKKELQDKLVEEIRALDVVIQRTNWEEEVEVKV
jgi:hypothetical protein